MAYAPMIQMIARAPGERTPDHQDAEQNRGDAAEMRQPSRSLSIYGLERLRRFEDRR